MKNKAVRGTNVRGMNFLSLASTMSLALVFCAVSGVPLAAQSTAGQSQQPSAQSAQIPEWQVAAGGHMEFDVASIKQDTAAPSPQTVSSNIPLGPQDLFSPTGGLFSAKNSPLL